MPFRQVRKHAAGTSSKGTPTGGKTFNALLPHYFETLCKYESPIVVWDPEDDARVVKFIVFGDFGENPNFQIKLESEENLRDLAVGEAAPIDDALVNSLVSAYGDCDAASEFIDYLKHYKGEFIYVADGNTPLPYDRDKRATLYVNGNKLASGIVQTAPDPTDCCEE